MAKKHYKKLLPKASGSLAVAVAMTVALSTQVHATELEETELLTDGNSPVPESKTDNVLNLDGMEPAEANGAIDQANQETVDENQQTAIDNQQTQQSNNNAAENNENTTGGALVNPELTLPDAPDVPDTDGMDAKDHNEAIGQYNGKVDEYNDAVNDYNDKVDEYNNQADAYDQDQQDQYTEDKEAYDEAKEEHEAKADAYAEYLKQLEAHEAEVTRLEAEYQAAMEAYKAAQAAHTLKEENYTAYQEQLEAHEAEVARLKAEYKTAMEAYKAAQSAHQEKADAYSAYQEQLKAHEAEVARLEAEYKTAMEAFKAAEDAHKEKADAYAAYQEQLKAHETEVARLQAEYQTAMEAYEAAQNAHALKEENYAAYQEKMKAYEAEVTRLKAEHKTAMEAYEAAQSAHQAKADAYSTYQEQLKAHEAEVTRLKAEHQTAMEAYEAAQSAHQKKVDAYSAYQERVKAHEAEVIRLKAEHETAMTQYNERLQQSQAAWEAYNQYLDKMDAYEKACTAYEAKLKLYQENFEQYLQDYLEVNGQNDAAYQEYLAAKAEYEQALALYNAFIKENTIFTDVTKYNEGINTENQKIDDLNAGLNNDVDGNAEDISGVGSANRNLTMDQEILDILGGYDSLVQEQAQLEQMGAALDAHEGKDSENLGSQEYTDYLAAVEAYNAAVESFNSKVDAYNEAVAAYNAIVDDYNEKQKDGSNSSTDEVQSTGTADWGNFKNKTMSFNHLDVRYQAAAVKDKIDDGKGNISYSDSISKYDVIGVYYDENAAKENPDEFGITYTDTRGQTVQYEMVKDDEHDEFCTASTDRKGEVDRTDASANKNTVVKFYATLTDSTGNTQGVQITLDANSVYAANSYLKYDSKDSLDDYKDSNGNPLTKVRIDDELYYDISGQSVFLISALACDGYDYRLGGLDLILNMQTIIEIYQADKAQTVSYLEFEKGKTAQISAPTPVDAPDALDVSMLEPELPEPPTPEIEPDVFDEVAPQLDLPDAPTPVENPGEFTGVAPELDLPDAPAPVEDPGEFGGIAPELDLPDAPEVVEDPGEFLLEEPDAPEAVERLDYVDPLEKLNEKLIILFDDYEPDPYFDEIEIPDEEVPLAAAPKTGDMSSLWSVLSGLSAAGMFLLGRKRKDEE